MFVEHKEALEVTEQPAKVLKFSEAIRIGAQIRPQTKANYFSRGRSCALGAAIEASGHAYGTYPEGWICDWFENTFAAPLDVISSIWVKNDTGWTREAIADWLEARGL